MTSGQRMVKISGNTYPVRIELKRLGGRWSPSANCWMVPPDKEVEAKALVSRCGTKKPGTNHQSGSKQRTCKDCGCRINYGVYCGKCEYR